LTAHFSFGMIVALLTIPAFAIVFVGLLSGKMAVAAICIGLAVVYLIVLALVQSACNPSFRWLYSSMRAGARARRVPPKKYSAARCPEAYFDWA